MAPLPPATYHASAMAKPKKKDEHKATAKGKGTGSLIGSGGVAGKDRVEPARPTEETGRRRAPDLDTRPFVIVDFEVSDDDALTVIVRNIGKHPAVHVRVRFEPPFRGLGGTLEIPTLALFHHLAFLAPGRDIRALVDPVSSYFGRRDPEEPRMILAQVTYRDARGRRYRARIRHDLRIWEDLPRIKANRHGDRT